MFHLFLWLATFLTEGEAARDAKKAAKDVRGKEKREASGLDDLVLGDLEVLASEYVEGIDSVGVVGVGLDLADDGSPLLLDGILQIRRKLLLEVFLILRAEGTSAHWTEREKEIENEQRDPS
jgi:hypothetical protein